MKEENRKNWYIRPFNGVFFGQLFFSALVFVIVCILLKGSSQQTRNNVLVGFMAFTMLFYFWYKHVLARDEEYSQICHENGIGEFSWWKELPFQMCNVNIYMIPIGVLTGSRLIQATCFFSSTLGTVLAIMMPAIGFSDDYIFKPRMIGFYGFHLMVLYGGIALLAFGIYQPQYGDALLAALGIAAETFGGFLISELIIHLKLNDHANYFFTVDTEGNAVLDFFWHLVPLPFLYLVLPMVLYGLYCLAVIFLLKLFI